MNLPASSFQVPTKMLHVETHVISFTFSKSDKDHLFLLIYKSGH